MKLEIVFHSFDKLDFIVRQRERLGRVRVRVKPLSRIREKRYNRVCKIPRPSPTNRNM